MKKIIIVAAALAGTVVPAIAQNFTIPAGDSAFDRSTAQPGRTERGFVALAPESLDARDVAGAPRAAHRPRWRAQ